MDYIVYGIIRTFASIAFWIFVIWLIVHFLRRRRAGTVVKAGAARTWWKFDSAVSKEEILSEAFFFCALVFLWVALTAFNRDIGDPFSWRTILLAALAAGFAVSYRFKTVVILALSVIGLQAWWVGQLVKWADADRVKGGWIFWGGILFVLTLYAVGRAHESYDTRKRFSLVYTVLSTAALTFALIFFSTKPGIEALVQASKGGMFFQSWEFTAAIVICLGALAAALVFALQRKRISWAETAAVLSVAAVAGIIALVPKQGFFTSVAYTYEYGRQWRPRSLTDTGALWAMVVNMVAFLEVIGIAVLGYLRKEEWMQKLGMMLLPLLLILKLIDWYFPLFDRSLFFILAGIAFIILARLQDRIALKSAPVWYTVMGLVSLTGALAFLSTRQGLRGFEKMTQGKESLWTPQGVLAWVLLFGFSAWLIWLARRKQLIAAYEAVAFLAFTALTGLLSLMPEQKLFLGSLGYGGYLGMGNELAGAGVLWAIIFNVIVFAEVVGIILLGYARKEELLVNFGAVFIFLIIILKYFDWFFTFLDKSLFFILAGVLMLGVGWLLERGRKYVLSTMTNEKLQMTN